MTDIWLGLTFVTAAFLLIAGLTWRWTKGASGLTRAAVALGSVLIGGGYVWFVRNDVRIANLLPFSNLIVVGNGVAYFTAVLIGLVASDPKLPTLRRLFSEVSLTIAAGYATIQPVLGAIPDCQAAKWQNEVCMQSTKQTCTAACAATILTSFGMETSEQEMATLCFSDKGTTWAGLYRGLSLKTAGANIEVRTFVKTIEALRELDCSEHPVILTVELTHENAKRYPVYADQYGWIPGSAHTVLFYGFTDGGRVAMGDPAVGREEWTLGDLELLWTGSGQMLVRRNQ